MEQTDVYTVERIEFGSGSPRFFDYKATKRGLKATKCANISGIGREGSRGVIVKYSPLLIFEIVHKGENLTLPLCTRYRSVGTFFKTENLYPLTFSSLPIPATYLVLVHRYNCPCPLLSIPLVFEG